MPVGRLWHCDDAPLSRDCRFPVVSFRAKREIFCLQTIDFSVASLSHSFEAGLLRNDKGGRRCILFDMSSGETTARSHRSDRGRPCPIDGRFPPHVISSEARNLVPLKACPRVIASEGKQSQLVLPHSLIPRSMTDATIRCKMRPWCEPRQAPAHRRFKERVPS